MHCGSSSILLVNFLGHVCKYVFMLAFGKSKAVMTVLMIFLLITSERTAVLEAAMLQSFAKKDPSRFEYSLVPWL